MTRDEWDALLWQERARWRAADMLGTVLWWAAWAHEKCDLVASRTTCKRKGHLWDSERPRGAIHRRDICWRCDAVREEVA